MNLLPGLSWLASMALRRKRPAEAECDLADMGTAFGLDASMAPEPVESHPRSRPAPVPPADRLIRRPRR